MPLISAKRLSRVGQVTETMTWPLFVTASMRAGEQGQAAESLLELKKALITWRRTVFWNETVMGGVQSIEVTNTAGFWHWHAHMLIDCRWLAVVTPAPQRGDPPGVVADKCKRAQLECEASWSGVVGSKSRVDVRRAREGSAMEVLKYAISGESLSRSRAPIGEVIRAIDSGRLISTFGSCYRFKFSEAEKHEHSCPDCGCGKGMVPATTQPAPFRALSPFATRKEARQWMADKQEHANVHFDRARIAREARIEAAARLTAATKLGTREERRAKQAQLTLEGGIPW